MSLANNMWIGTIPTELKSLTVPEVMLISLVYIQCFIFKLCPKTFSSGDPSMLQRGMMGNITTYKLDMKQIIQMLHGSKMLCPTRILASVITITYISTLKLPKNWLKSTFHVQQQKVLAALQWLITNNPHYAKYEINEGVLATLRGQYTY